MNDITPPKTLSAEEHAREMADYIAEGTRRAHEIRQSWADKTRCRR